LGWTARSLTAFGRWRSLQSWGRFNETVSPVIYGQNESLLQHLNKNCFFYLESRSGSAEELGNQQQKTKDPEFAPWPPGNLLKPYLLVTCKYVHSRFFFYNFLIIVFVIIWRKFVNKSRKQLFTLQRHHL
jgi:hypothetical protein